MNKHTAKSLLIRQTSLFAVLFVLVSAVIGLHIDHDSLFWRYGFQVYAGAGKGLLFAIIVFLILIIRRNEFPVIRKWCKKNFWWLVPSLLSVVGAWLSISKLANKNHIVIFALTAHLCIIISILSLALLTYGVKNLATLYSFYKRELMTSLLAGVAYIVFLYIVYSLWGLLSSIVLNSVKWMFGVVNIHAVYMAPRTLIFSKFAITVAEGCSGIESIALFSALYIFIGFLDWVRLNHKKLLITFIPALILLFIFNILRVFVLILGGYYINPKIAFSLFHTYAGMVFFIIYAALFWSISYKWMLNKTSKLN